MAKQASRKVSPPKKSSSVGRAKVAAAPMKVKAKASKPAPVIAKTKPAARSIAVAIPKKSAVKSNGASKAAVVKSVPKPVIAAKPAPLKSKAPEPRKIETRRVEPLPPPRPIPIPEAVPTNGKPRKNQAGLSSKELEHFRDLLLEKRRELVGDMYSMESEALRTDGSSNLSSLPIHMADMGTDNYEQEFTLGLVEKDRGLLREINSALAKIQNGTYGICEGTGKPINKVRLEAQPWAKHSIEYARQTQRPMGMGRVG